MDFSKIKKIFYIVAIISMLLSIKSKVFGATIELDDNSVPVSFILPDFVINNDNYIFCFLSQNWGTKYITFIFSEDEISFTSASNSRYKLNSSKYIHKSYMYTSQSHSDIQNILDNLTTNDYITSETYLNSFYLDQSINNSNGLISYASNQDIKIDNNIVYTTNFSSMVFPSFDNTQEIEQGNPDGVFISAGDFSNTDNIYFHLLEVTTGLSNQDNSRYYYNDHTFILNKDSNFYSTYIDSDYFYYYIPRYKLGLSQNTSYLYVLNNSKKQIQNSNGIIEIDKQNGVFDVVESDTSGVITATEEETDRMKNIQSTIAENQETVNNINDTLTNTNVEEDTETDIDNNLNFSNSAPQFSSLFNGFFSRLTTIISDLGNYQDTDVITVHLPIPFTNDTIPISSDFIFSNQNNNFLKNIATLLWYFIFGRYFLYFLINTYWLITNGQFFDNYLTQKEAITGDML